MSISALPSALTSMSVSILPKKMDKMNCRRKIPVLTKCSEKIYVSFHIFCVYLFFNSQNKAINPKKQEDKGRNVAVYVQLSTFFYPSGGKFS